ncbi:MAG: methyltransferase domain-containing protein [Myxococcales bacterium]|nr:methyltransferase domain-containing protein [Myxococcales bacterium]
MTWKQAWEEGRTPWDIGQSPPALLELVREGNLPRGRAVVPGCGSGYDVLALAGDGRHVTGFDLAPLAAVRFEELRAKEGVDPDRAEVRIGDFLLWEPPEAVDLVWDYTFLCALAPNQRRSWAERMASVVRSGGELITLIFPTSPLHGDADRPPYVIDADLVRRLLGDDFSEKEVRPVLHSAAGRGGKEILGRWVRR